MAAQKPVSARSKTPALSEDEKLRAADEKWVAWAKKTWGDSIGDLVAERVAAARQTQRPPSRGGRGGKDNLHFDRPSWELSAGLTLMQGNQLEKEDAWRRQNSICQNAASLFGGHWHEDQGEAAAGVRAAMSGALESWSSESTRQAPRAQVAWVASQDLKDIIWYGGGSKRWGEGVWIWRPVAGGALPFLASAGAYGESGVYPQEAWAAAARIYAWDDALFTQAYPAGHWRVLGELPMPQNALSAPAAKKSFLNNVRAIGAGASAAWTALKKARTVSANGSPKSFANAWRTSRQSQGWNHKKAVAQEKHDAASLELAQIWAMHRASAQRAAMDEAKGQGASIEMGAGALATGDAATAEPTREAAGDQKRKGMASRFMQSTAALGARLASWATRKGRDGREPFDSLGAGSHNGTAEEAAAVRSLALAAEEERAVADAMLFWEHEPVESRRTAPEWILGPKADQEFSVGVAFAKALRKKSNWEAESVGIMERKFASPGLPGSIKALSEWMKNDAFAKAASEAQALKRALVGSSRSSGLKGALMACALMERTGWTDEARKAVASRPRSKEGVIAARAAEEFANYQRATTRRWWAEERRMLSSPDEERFAGFLQELADTHVACFEQQRLREVIEAAKKPLPKRRKKKTGEDGADFAPGAESANHEGDKGQASAQSVAEAGYGEGSEDDALWATESEPTRPEAAAQPMEPPPVRKARRL